MKYLAILRDSLLEALDTKVFYVMVGLSCLALLVVGSTSYYPVTVESEVRRMTDTLTWVLGAQGKKLGGGAPRIEIADFRQTNPGVPPWEGDYRFALVMHFPNAEGVKLDQAIPRESAHNLERALRQHFPYLNELQVVPANAAVGGELRYQVSSHGTQVTRATDWPHEPVVLFAIPIRFWHAPIGEFVHFWEDILVNSIGAGVALLLSSIITAFFIPNMLRKGTIDFLLVKPIHRTTLLIYKYIGGLTFIFLNTILIVVGVWFLLGLRTGMWGIGFLACIFVITFQFALYYAVSTLFGVLTRSSIVAILMSCLAWFLFMFVVGYGYRIIDTTRKIPEMMAGGIDEEGEPLTVSEKPLPDWVYTTADVIHLVTPRLKDLDVLVNKLIVDDTMPAFSQERKMADKLYAGFRWSEALTVTTIYILIFLALACWRFATKDY